MGLPRRKKIEEKILYSEWKKFHGYELDNYNL